jgi:hypothetical protein
VSNALEHAALVEGSFGNGAAGDGYPDDAKWETDWEFFGLTMRDEWLEVVRKWLGPSAQPTHEELGQLFAVRWRKGPGNSPWRGLFEGNLTKARVVNLFNREDRVFTLSNSLALGGPWQAAQRIQKPSTGGLGLDNEDFSADPRYGAFTWVRLPYATAEEIQLFDSPDMAQEAKFLQLREWSELAFWFSALSMGAAVTPIAPGGATNCDMTAVGQVANIAEDVRGGYISHTYMTSKPVWATDALYRALSAELRGLPGCVGGTQP